MMPDGELAAIHRVEDQVVALRGEMVAGFHSVEDRMQRHEARHEALDDASRERQVSAEHRLTALSGSTESNTSRLDERTEALTKRLCTIEKTVRRGLWAAALAGLGVVGSTIGSALGLGNPSP